MNKSGSRGSRVFHQGTLEAQSRFANPDRADKIINAMPSISELDDEQIDFVQTLPFFFIATADRNGRLQCNFKGGGPGILVAETQRRLCYPEFPGNDLMLSVGNMLSNPHVGLLALSFETRRRLKINGRAEVTDAKLHPFARRWENARIIVTIEIEEVIRNCTRRIPRLLPADDQTT